MEADTSLKEIQVAASDVAWLVARDPHGQASSRAPRSPGLPGSQPSVHPNTGVAGTSQTPGSADRIHEPDSRDMEPRPPTYGHTAASWESPRLQGLGRSRFPIIFLTSD